MPFPRTTRMAAFGALLTMSLIAGAGCTATLAPSVIITPVAVDALPASVTAAVAAAAPGIRLTTAERKEREARVYFDVGGLMPDGTEIEIDVLMAGPEARVVEIQRDVNWADVPAPVRLAATAERTDFVPARIIESRQTDGVVIYELFAPGASANPALEIRWTDDVATVLTTRWPH